MNKIYKAIAQAWKLIRLKRYGVEERVNGWVPFEEIRTLGITSRNYLDSKLTFWYAPCFVEEYCVVKTKDEAIRIARKLENKSPPRYYL